MKDFEKITGTFLFGVFLFSFGGDLLWSGIWFVFGAIFCFFGGKMGFFRRCFLMKKEYNNFCSTEIGNRQQTECLGSETLFFETIG